ncbi:MAG: ABC-F family ATP-binding cassette domain-containing protein [Elusimicrobia bacterium]|nr:ABC-F family ATP-binding cassette domain-containing protein [Elusimicrobiota bacterium]
MITIRNLRKDFGGQTLFDKASLQINERDRYALVGPNGSGKSTLFKMLLGETEPDGGELQIRKGAVVGYLPQETALLGAGSVISEILAHMENPEPKLVAKAKAVSMGLGFKVADFDKSAQDLSGGWTMRVAIARLLIEQPDLLLLDEPTNHLDLDSLLWFQEYLQNYEGAVFLISHDRAFIDAICGAIVSVQDHALKTYHGSYETFLKARQVEREKLESAFHQQQIQIEQMEEFIARNRARLSSAGRAQSMIKRLEKLERIELPQESKKAAIRFPQPQRAGARVLALKNVSKAYGPVKVYEGLDFHVERGWKMAFVGHNGAGKSTLLKMLAGIVPPDSGERVLGVNARVGYYSQHRAEMLDTERTVFEEAFSVTRIGQTEEMIRTVLGTFLFPGNSVYKKVNVLSGGEKSRLGLVKLLLDPPNVLLMDEPTTHLDIPSVEALIAALREYEGTVCFISHDLYLINSLANYIVHIDSGRVALYPGNYEYFSHRQNQIAKEKETQKQEEPVSETTANKPQAAPPVCSKKERQERAKQRERARAVENLKNEINRIQTKIADLVRQMEDPRTHQDFNKVSAIGQEIRTLQGQLSAKEQELSAY